MVKKYDQNTGTISVIPSSLQVANIDIAHQSTHICQNQQRRINKSTVQRSTFLPLTEKIAPVFFQKTAHLGDHDFIKIDHKMLQMIGFENNFSVKRDKK